MIFFVAMPFVIGFMNFVVPLQLGVRDVAFPTMNNVSFWLTASGALLVNLSLFIGEFARTGWLGFPPLSETAFSPGVGVDYYLVALQISGVGTVLTARQFRDHDPEDPRAGHELHAHAGLLLDRTRLQPDHARRVSGPDRHLGAADARPLPRLPFLHERRRRQLDALHEPDLGLGASGGLHPRPAGVRHLFRSRRDLLRQAAVRLPVDGLRDAGDLHHLLHGLAAPFLHHGRRRRHQRRLRHRQHDHRHSDRGEDLQLAVHDVRRPGPLQCADAII